MSEGLRVILHPLPILNISEHLTRTSLQLNDANIRVIGGLLGTLSGRDLEIMNSFELVLQPTEPGGQAIKLDHEYFITRRDQFKQVFPTFDVLGWYSIGDEPNEHDLNLHNQFLIYNETALFLQLSRHSSKGSKELPVKVYETQLEIQEGLGTRTNLIKTKYEIETGEAERVAVDHVAKPENSNKAGNQSSLVASLTTQRNAIKMLHERISVILSYLTALSRQQVEKDEETLRQISALVNSLKGNDSVEYRQEFLEEYNDVLLTTWLSEMTSGLLSANDLLDKQLLLLSGTGSNVRGGGGGSGETGNAERGSGSGFGGPSGNRRRGIAGGS